MAQIKNIKITDAKLCGECSTIQTSNFIHLTSAIIHRKILREFVMSKVPSGNLCNAEMIVELFRPQLEHQTSYFNHQPSLRLYHHRNLIGSPSAFIKVIKK